MSVPAFGYSLTASWLHWATALPLIGCVGTVLKAQQAPKEEKGQWMFRHKSLGLLTGMIVAPRVAYRVISSGSYHVQKLSGHPEVLNMAAGATHLFLYAFMTVMPATGIAMGLYGGKGLPFFWTTLPGFEQTNGGIAKQAFQIHKQLGTYGKYAIPLHVGGAAFHTVRGEGKYPNV